MLRIFFLVTFLFTVTFTFSQNTYEYPNAPKDTTVNTYFDTTIADPYQWMESPDDPRIKEWLEAQRELIRKQKNKQYKKWTLRDQIANMYTKVHEEKKETYVTEKDKEKSKYVYDLRFKSSRETQDLCYRARGRNNFHTLVNTEDFEHGKNDNVIVTDWAVNEIETHIAVTLSHSGSDWREVYFFDLRNGDQLKDTLRYLRQSSNLIWHDGGIYYDRFDKPKKGRELLDKAKGQSLYYHEVGSSQASDKLLYQNPDTTGTNKFRFFKMDDNRLFFYHYFNTRGKIYKALSFVPLDKGKSFYLRNFLIFPNKEISFEVNEVFGDTVILSTDWKASTGKVMAAHMQEKNKLVNIVPPRNVTLKDVNQLGKDKIACIYRHKGRFFVMIHNLKGRLLKRIDIPKGKKVKYFYENDPDAKYMDFCISSFYHPNLWYQLSLKDLTFKPSKEIRLPYNHEKLETRYVEYRSKDGTLVPMYITCREDIKLNGKNPTLIYGYGGYGSTVEPGFKQSQTLWLLHGGVLAIPNIRGGGAKGTKWSKQGRGLKKQNTIDDFIAASKYLIEKNYTNPDKLAIHGKSHGGMLIGAVVTQRPDLYKAAISEAGAFDMLRYEKFTVGSTSANLNEFGSVSNRKEFENLLSYSPLHNVKKGVEYPNMLFFTGDHDDRVPPLHTYKFLATLQEKGSPKSLYHMYVLPGTGHGGALTIDEWISKMIYKYYYLYNQLDVRFW